MPNRLFIVAAILTVALGLPARAAEDVELWSAFAAAFGARSPVTWTVQRPEHPPGCNCGGSTETVSMDVGPEMLVRLDGDRYALIVSEDETPPASPPDPGAISVAYLRRTKAGWKPERVWREVTWSGSKGEAFDQIGVRFFGKDGLVVATKSMGGQGQSETFAWIIALTPEGPKRLGDVPLDGLLAADSCPSCSHYAFQGDIGPPMHEGAALSVAYAGWTIPGFRSSPKTPFAVVADYDEAGGELKPERDPHLPDGENKTKPGDDPPSAAAAFARLPPETPRAFANQIVALYQKAAHTDAAGRLWDQWHDSLYDPELLAMIGEDRQLENRAGELDLDHDPLCGCNGDPAYARILKVAPRKDGMAEVDVSYCDSDRPGPGSPASCRRVDLVIARIEGVWRLYDVKEPGSLRATLVNLMNRLRGEPVWIPADR